jgi:uncharacterized protein YggE
MKTTTTLAMMIVTCAVACAGERFVSTIGTVEKEIPADRLEMTVVVQATEKTIPESIASLDRLLEEFGKQMSALGYPSTATSVKERQTKRGWDWIDQKQVPSGFSSTATLSVRLLSLTNYSKLLTYIGTRQEFEVTWLNLSGSEEGAVRKVAIAEALQAARAKAESLAVEGKAKLGKLLEAAEEEVEVPEYGRVRRYRNARDPHEGSAAYPIEVTVRVRAKFELDDQ